MELPYTVEMWRQPNVYSTTFDIRDVTKGLPDWDQEVHHIRYLYSSVDGSKESNAIGECACMAVKGLLGGEFEDYTATLANGVATVTRKPQ